MNYRLFLLTFLTLCTVLCCRSRPSLTGSDFWNRSDLITYILVQQNWFHQFHWLFNNLTIQCFGRFCIEVLVVRIPIFFKTKIQICQCRIVSKFQIRSFLSGSGILFVFVDPTGFCFPTVLNFVPEGIIVRAYTVLNVI